MSFTQLLNRWGWLVLVIGGALWGGFHIWIIQIGTVNDPEKVIPVVWILGVATIFLLVSLFTLFFLAASIWARAGISLTLVGVALFALGTILTSAWTGSAWLLAIIGEMITTIGLLVFGFANLWEKLLGNLFWLPLLMAPIYFLSWSIDPGTVRVPFENWTEWLAAVYGLGWVIVGTGLYIQEKTS